MDADRKRGKFTGVRIDGRMVAGRSMAIAVDFDHPDETEKALATGGHMTAPYTATLSDGNVEVRLIVDVIDAHVSCTSYSITAVDGVGLEHRTTEVFRGMKLRELLANVIAVFPDTTPGDFDAAAAIVDAAGASVQRRRRPVDDDRLSEVAQAYEERWVPGSAGYYEFARSIGASERQMWNLLRLARERGFLPEKGSS